MVLSSNSGPDRRGGPGRDTAAEVGDREPRRLSSNHADHMPLIVAHTDSHSDHVAGDAQLQALGDPDIPVAYVAPTVDATKVPGIGVHLLGNQL